MTPEIAEYINEKKRLLTEEFCVVLTLGDMLQLKRCTTFSSVDVACRKILKRKLDSESYIS